MIRGCKKLLVNTYNTYSVYRFTRSSNFIGKRFYSDIISISNPEASINESFFLEPEEVPPPVHESKSNVSVLEEQTVLEDVSDVGPPVDFRAFNFAAFVNHSDVLKKFVDLGVDFSTLDKKIPRPDYLLSLNLDTDVAPYMKFLLDNGLSIDDLGRFFTKNPYFFMNSLSNLQVRINYLESKKFDRDTITRLIRNNARWLNYPTVEVDRRLGYLQEEFKMKGFEVRMMLNNYPQILNTSKKYIRETLFEFRDVQEFSLGQCKNLLINHPNMWTVQIHKLSERLEYLIVEMEIPRYLIVADPSALMFSIFHLKHRHTFLKSLGRAQYDPKKPNYVSPKALCLLEDADFCQEVAKTSIETYNLYLKTL